MSKNMQDDAMIVDLFWDRNDNALKLLSDKYDMEFMHISFRILNNREDSEECLNDAYLNTWNSIPDARPTSLFAYVGKIIRNLSINRVKKNMAQKRGSNNEIAILLSELQECVSAKENVESIIEYNELSKDISKFLLSVKKEKRMIFIERYWYAKSIKEIAGKYKMSYKKVESGLYWCRKKLREYLEEKNQVQIDKSNSNISSKTGKSNTNKNSPDDLEQSARPSEDEKIEINRGCNYFGAKYGGTIKRVTKKTWLKNLTMTFLTAIRILNTF